MNKIGIYFGTDTGTTRLIAKKLAKKLGDELAAKPVNVNRTDVQEFLQYDALILGTPTYGLNQLPGLDTGIKDGSWAEFLAKLDAVDLSGKCIALYGLGNQEKYSERFADSLIHLYQFFTQKEAQLVGSWDTAGYSFTHSQAVVDGRFVGLVLDQQCQSLLTEQRLDEWLTQITPALAEKLGNPESAVV